MAVILIVKVFFLIREIFPIRQVRQSDGEALASRFGCAFFEVSACQDFHSVQQVFREAVRRARKGGACGCLVPAIYASEDKALLGVPSFTTPCYKELPVPANAKLITVKTSRAQSKRRASTLTLLKGFKIFWHILLHVLWYCEGLVGPYADRIPKKQEQLHPSQTFGRFNEKARAILTEGSS